MGEARRSRSVNAGQEGLIFCHKKRRILSDTLTHLVDGDAKEDIGGNTEIVVWTPGRRECQRNGGGVRLEEIYEQ